MKTKKCVPCTRKYERIISIILSLMILLSTAVFTSVVAAEDNYLLEETFSYDTEANLYTAHPKLNGTELVYDAERKSKVLKVVTKDVWYAINLESAVSEGKWVYEFYMKSGVQIERVKLSNSGTGGVGLKSESGNTNIKDSVTDLNVAYGFADVDGVRKMYWHQYRYYLDMDEKTFTLFVDGVEKATGAINKNSLNQIDIKISSVDNDKGINLWLDDIIVKRETLEVTDAVVENNAVKVSFNQPVADSCVSSSYFTLTKNGTALLEDEYAISKSGNDVILTPNGGMNVTATWKVTVKKATTAADAAYGTMEMQFNKTFTTEEKEAKPEFEGTVLLNENFDYASEEDLLKVHPNMKGSIVKDPDTGSKVYSVEDTSYHAIAVPNGGISSGKWIYSFDLKLKGYLERLKLNNSGSGGFGFSCGSLENAIKFDGQALDDVLLYKGDTVYWNSYTVKIDMDANPKTATVFVNGVEKKTTTFTTTLLNAIHIHPQEFNSSHTVYLDNVVLREDLGKEEKPEVPEEPTEKINALIDEKFDYESEEDLLKVHPGLIGSIVKDPDTGSKVYSVEDTSYHGITVPNGGISSGKWIYSFDLKLKGYLERFKLNNSGSGGFGFSCGSLENAIKFDGQALDDVLLYKGDTVYWNSYTVKIDMDANPKTATVFVNGVEKKTSTFTTTPLNAIHIHPKEFNSSHTVYLDNILLKEDHIEVTDSELAGNTIKLTFNYPVAQKCLTSEYFTLIKDGAALKADEYKISAEGSVVMLTPNSGFDYGDAYTVKAANNIEPADSSYKTTQITFTKTFEKAFNVMDDGSENFVLNEKFDYESTEEMASKLTAINGAKLVTDPDTGSNVLSVEDTDVYHSIKFNAISSGKWAYGFDAKAHVRLERIKLTNANNGGGVGLKIDSGSPWMFDSTNPSNPNIARLFDGDKLYWNNYYYVLDFDANPKTYTIYVNGVEKSSGTIDKSSLDLFQVRTVTFGENDTLYIDNVFVKEAHIEAIGADVKNGAVIVYLNTPVSDKCLDYKYFELSKNDIALSKDDYTVAKSGNKVILTPKAGVGYADKWSVKVANSVEATDASFGTTVVTKTVSTVSPKETKGALYSADGTIPVTDIAEFAGKDIKVKCDISRDYSDYVLYVALYDGNKLVDIESTSKVIDESYECILSVPETITNAKVSAFMWDIENDLTPLRNTIEIYPKN